MLPLSCNGTAGGMVRSGPASAEGAPGDRGPSLAPVVRMTSKLVTDRAVRWLKALAGQRRSGTAETEKNELLLSAMMPPYFLSAAATAFSCLVQLLGTTKVAFKRSRWPMAGTSGLVVDGDEAKWVAG